MGNLWLGKADCTTSYRNLKIQLQTDIKRTEREIVGNDAKRATMINMLIYPRNL